MVAACAAGYLEGTPLLDMNYLEDSAGGPDVSVALHPHLDKMVLVQMDSKLPLDTFEGVLGLAVKGCQSVAEYMRAQLLEHTKRLALARGA
jgi:exosome complex component RRP41